MREGSRWVEEPPTADEVAEWFHGQPLHDGMAHGPYLGGIIVIAQEEKVKVTKRNAQDRAYIAEEDRTAYTPYVRVDTRVRYFRDYVELLNRPEDGEPNQYVGVIEPVPQRRVTDPSSAFYNENLPEGFSWFAVRQGNETVRRFVVATFECAIYERQSYLERRNGQPPVAILQGRGSKQVPTNYKGQHAWADDAAIMKAETGAIGRALGVAGVLVVGTGVATAEDIQEAVSTAQGTPGGGTSATPTLPPVVDREGQPVAGDEIPAETGAEAPQEAAQQPEGELSDEELRERAAALRGELEGTSPEAWAAYVEWYTNERQFPPLDKLTGSALRGAVIKLERTLDEAKA